MAKRFVNKVVWITGGGSGIGEGLAREFARQGAKVAISGRRLHKLEGVVQSIEDAGGEDALPVQCDVTEEAQVEQAVAQIVEHWGRLDVAVANAGFAVAGTIEKLDAEDWRRQFDTNVVGVAITARHALPHLKKVDGRVALMGSVAGVVSAPGNGPYHASKFAVRAIGQTLAMELAATGVSCTTIQPGYVASEIGQVDNRGSFREEWEDKRPQAIMWSAERAAKVCVEAIWQRKQEFTFTGHGKAAAFVGKHAPGLIVGAYAGFKKLNKFFGSS